MRYFYFILFQFVCSQIWSQTDVESKVREYVDTLCSPSFFGRGYEHQGCEKAGKYLSEFIQQNELKPLGRTYSQAYSFPVVSHEGDQRLFADDQELQLGSSFFPHPSNANAQGTGVLIRPKLGKKPSNKKVARKLKRSLRKGEFWLLTNTSFWKQNWPLKNFINNYQVCIWEEEKLTGHISSTLNNQPSFYTKKGVVTAGQTIRFTTSGELSDTHQKNIFATVPGFSDSLLIFTAHYDHIGGWGNKTFVPGANDNASGTALLMGLINQLNQGDVPPYTLAFVFFSGEEAGLKGSKYFVDNLPVDPSLIKAVYNLDLVGTGSDGITVVNGKEEVKLFQKITNFATPLFPKVVVRGQAANSDHYWFSKAGIPAVFIYGMGPRTAYHDVSDVPETMPQPKLAEFLTLLTKLIYE